MQVCGLLECGWEWRGSRGTYDAEGPDQDVGWHGVRGDHVGDEVGGHADDGDEGDALEGADDGEGCAEGAVLWCRHNGWF